MSRRVKTPGVRRFAGVALALVVVGACQSTVIVADGNSTNGAGGAPSSAAQTTASGSTGHAGGWRCKLYVEAERTSCRCSNCLDPVAKGQCAPSGGEEVAACPAAPWKCCVSHGLCGMPGTDNCDCDTAIPNGGSCEAWAKSFQPAGLVVSSCPTSPGFCEL